MIDPWAEVICRPWINHPNHHQAPEPAWNQRHGDVEMVRLLQNRILELEAENKAYEELLTELPDLFERKFQHRLEPIIERYRLLAEQVNPTETSQPAQLEPAPDNVVRFPVLRLPRFLRKQRRSG